jgi:hypothetical protein
VPNPPPYCVFVLFCRASGKTPLSTTLSFRGTKFLRAAIRPELHEPILPGDLVQTHVSPRLRLQRAFKNLRGQGKLTEEHLDAALTQIREAMLEGDVAVSVADELLVNIRAKPSPLDLHLPAARDVSQPPAASYSSERKARPASGRYPPSTDPAISFALNPPAS